MLRLRRMRVSQHLSSDFLCLTIFHSQSGRNPGVVGQRRVLGDGNDSVIRGNNTPAAFNPTLTAALCPTCGEGTERRGYPSGAALAAAAVAAALLFVFVVGVAVGAALASPWVGVGPAVAMAAVPCAMSASKRAISEPLLS